MTPAEQEFQFRKSVIEEQQEGGNLFSKLFMRHITAKYEV